MFFEMIREGRNGRIEAVSERRPAEVLKKVENDFCREPAEPRSVRGVLEGAGGKFRQEGKDNMVKRIQVYGGCLGAGRRRRPW